MEYCEIITGSMFSGKTEEFKRRINRYIIAGKKCQVFKPSIDDRYSETKILTHDIAKAIDLIKEKDIKNTLLNSVGLNAISLSDSNYLFDYLQDDTKIVGIDEVQLFDDDIIKVIDKLLENNIRVICSGLDMYANGDIFDITAKICCKSKYVTKLHAVCIDCGKEAMYSYKIDNNEDNKSAKIDVGSYGKYIALCEKCREKRLEK